MKPWGMVALTAAVLVAGTVTYFALQPEGSSETDADAQRIAECLAIYPMAGDAAGFARRLHDHYSHCGGADVLEYTDIGDRSTPADKPTVRLVLRIHHDEYDGWFTHRDAITACYRMEFDYYGLDDDPDRVDCPPGAPALLPPGVKRDGVPDGYAEAFKTVLTALPPTPSTDEVLAAVRAKLPPLPIDEHGQPWQEPVLGAAVENGDIAVVADGGRDKCLEGVRLADGTLTVGIAEPSSEKNAVRGCAAEGALLSKRHK